MARRLKEAKSRPATEGTIATVIKEGLCRLERNDDEVEWIMTGRGEGDRTMKEELRKAKYGKGDRILRKIMSDIAENNMTHDCMNRVGLIPG